MKLGQNLMKTFFDYYKATGYIGSRLLAAMEPAAKHQQQQQQQQTGRDGRQQ